MRKALTFAFLNSFALFAAAACSAPVTGDAEFVLRLDTETNGSGCKSALCSDYGMSCGGTLLMQIVDADTGELLKRNGDEEPLRACLAAPVDTNICSLASLAPQLRFFGVPPVPARVEVALFSRDDVPGDCPRFGRYELFDAFGQPQLNVSPQPAFAGSAYFQGSSPATVSIPLSCPNSDLLDSLTCEANLPLSVIATVRDLDTVQGIRNPQVQSVKVEVGTAKQETNNVGELEFILGASQTTELSLNEEGATPVFQNSVVLNTVQPICIITTEGVSEVTPSVTCQTAQRIDPLPLQGLLIPKAIVEKIVTTVTENGIPEEGILIGRAVNENFLPKAGIRVFPSLGSVVYLSEDLSSIGTQATTSSGYFASLDVPFGSSWTATDQDSHTQRGAPIGGLVHERIASILIRMTGDVIAPN